MTDKSNEQFLKIVQSMLDFTSQEISEIAEAREKLSKPSKQGSIKTESSGGDEKKQKGLKDLFKLNKSKNMNES